MSKPATEGDTVLCFIFTTLFVVLVVGLLINGAIKTIEKHIDERTAPCQMK